MLVDAQAYDRLAPIQQLLQLKEDFGTVQGDSELLDLTTRKTGIGRDTE